MRNRSQYALFGLSLSMPGVESLQFVRCSPGLWLSRSTTTCGNILACRWSFGCVSAGSEFWALSRKSPKRLTPAAGVCSPRAPANARRALLPGSLFLTTRMPPKPCRNFLHALRTVMQRAKTVFTSGSHFFPITMRIMGMVQITTLSRRSENRFGGGREILSVLWSAAPQVGLHSLFP